MEKKKKKTIFKNIMKKTSILMLSALLIFTSVFSSYDMNVDASSSDKGVIGKLYDFCYNSIYSVQDFSEMVWDKIAGGVWDYNGNYVYEAPTRGNTPDATLDWYINPSETGEREHGGGGKYFGYQYNKGVETPQNTTNYNTTRNMSIHNVNKTWNTTTNNYDYTYNWYNPITNNYDITNEYYYNTEYNMYNYVTHNYDITNNFNYTTNYYIQDNRTYISYYIINVCDETGEEERDYIEMYYELPDGRNSLYLTVDDIKGQYFPSNYSKYVSVAEDDGTTLGLWHLDGDLKDSSYHGNTAGSAYNNVYTDGLYTNGKKFSDRSDDFMELKLDKVDLPNSWTLEWCEYIPSASTYSHLGKRNKTFFFRKYATSEMDVPCDDELHLHLFSDDYYFDHNFALNNYISLNGQSEYFEMISGYFIPYAMTFDGSNYRFYKNGVLCSDSISGEDFNDSDILLDMKYSHVPKEDNPSNPAPNFKCDIGSIQLTSDSIIFDTSTRTETVSKSGEYVFNYFDTGFTSGYDCTCFYVLPRFNLSISAHKNAVIDEVRLSSGVLYTGDTYTPSSQPFTTNTVLAVPENPSKHEIAFKTNTDISEVRFGGAKPTYPTNGYVYVSLDADDKVESIQQYQEDGWFEIEASLYTGTEWTSFKNYNMEYLGIDGVGDSDDSGGDTGDDSGGDTGDDTGGDSSGGGVSAILEGIGKFFDTLLTLVGKIIGMLSDFVNSVLTLFESFTVFTDGFSGFLTGAFGFIPQEAINVIVTGITLLVILAIIKFLK